MSRYYVNKVLRAASIDEDEFKRYRADVAAYLDSFELTSAERRAFLDEDYPNLYALGAHPFLLNSFVMMFADPKNERAHAESFRDSITPYGHPSFDT